LNILYKITIFEISFERRKIFEKGYYQKVAHKNLEKKIRFKRVQGDLKWIHLNLFEFLNLFK
jgi:hypothetical protein